MPNTGSLSRFAKAAVSLEVFLSLGALGGGGALMLGPRGEIIPLPLSVLKGSPFETYFAPGLILFCALGLAPLAAAQLVWRRHPHAQVAVLGVGVALLIWMAVEVAIVGYTNSPPLQPFYMLLGAVITGVGAGLAERARTIGAALRIDAARRAPTYSASGLDSVGFDHCANS